jgi:hypothetical protein
VSRRIFLVTSGLVPPPLLTETLVCAWGADFGAFSGYAGSHIQKIQRCLLHEAQRKKLRIEMNLPRSVAAAVITAMLLLCSTAMFATNASCSFETFSAPSGYTLNLVNGISDDGTVVGQLIDNKTQAFVAFTLSPSGAFTEYAAPKSAMTWMYGRSGTGADAGFYQDNGASGHIHGFQLQNGTFTAVDYPKATNTWLFDTNMTGGSVGSFSNSPSVTKGFMLVNGKYTTIAYSGAQVTYASAISDNGEVVGSYASGAVSNGFSWQNGKFTTINHPKSKYGTVLTGVNNSGLIVGNRISSDKSFGFIYENGVFKSIVYPGGNFSVAGGVNNNGLISGQIFFTGGKTQGFTAVCK